MEMLNVLLPSIKELVMMQERPLPWFSWLCSVECKEVHNDLQHLVLTSPRDIDASKLRILMKTEEGGLTSEYEPKVKWQLLSGVHKTSDNETLFAKATAIFQVIFVCAIKIPPDCYVYFQNQILS